MKNQNNLGQTLFEKEMKNIKGGHEFTSPGGANLCPKCGSWALEHLGDDKYRCMVCASVIDNK